MDNEYILTADGELYHWGIKGMRWGVRRYQNKDGSLTPAGRKHYNDEAEKLREREKVVKRKERVKERVEKLKAKQAELDAREKALEPEKKPKKEKKTKEKPATTDKPKSMKDMSSEELKAHTQRMIDEKNYLRAQQELAVMTPAKVNKGKEFLKGVLNDVIVPAAKNVGKEYIESVLLDKLGLSDPIKKLKREAELADLEYKKTKSEVDRKKLLDKDSTNDNPDESTWDNKTKKQTYDKNERDRKSGLEDYKRHGEFAKERFGGTNSDEYKAYMSKVAKQLGLDFYEGEIVKPKPVNNVTTSSTNNSSGSASSTSTSSDTSGTSSSSTSSTARTGAQRKRYQEMRNALVHPKSHKEKEKAFSNYVDNLSNEWDFESASGSKKTSAGKSWIENFGNGLDTYYNSDEWYYRR